MENRIQSGTTKKAFISDNQEVTTGQFIHGVRRISEQFQNRHFQKGSRILILSRKSIPVIAAIYSCLFNGYVFIPVDPGTPEERLKFIINDCSPSGMIIDDANLDKLGPGFFKDYPHISIFSFENLEAVDFIIPLRFENIEPDELSLPEVSGLTDKDIAYIIYTSGSTGAPKGVVVSRSALGSFIESSIQRAGYTSETMFLNFFPLHFDPMLMEIIMPWVTGGTTVLFNKFLFINDLVKALQKYRITDFSCTPNIISMLVSRISHYPKYDWSFFRSIWFGGETANMNDLKRFWEITPHVKLFNGYGPTETVVACSLHELRPEDLQGEILPIGSPMNGVIFKIVDQGKEVQGESIAGELYVGGTQLMDGYWGKMGDLEKNNFEIFADRKYYKTADNVFQKNGLYYFVGRKNAMIKFRGYRIFPSEIENALNSLDEISSCCVLFDEKNEQLVGVVELEGISGEEPELTENIVTRLKTKLPMYMIPEKIVYEEQLPRMNTGKLDIQRIKAMLEV
jgi:amino acid adenylation domain-containing protein